MSQNHKSTQSSESNSSNSNLINIFERYRQTCDHPIPTLSLEDEEFISLMWKDAMERLPGGIAGDRFTDEVNTRALLLGKVRRYSTLEVVHFVVFKIGARMKT